MEEDWNPDGQLTDGLGEALYWVCGVVCDGVYDVVCEGVCGVVYCVVCGGVVLFSGVVFVSSLGYLGSHVST